MMMMITIDCLQQNR